MYKIIINFFYWFLIKSSKSQYGSPVLEVGSAANKIVQFNIQGSIS